MKSVIISNFGNYIVLYFLFWKLLVYLRQNIEYMRLLINERIKEAGITKYELAEKLGMSASSLAKRLNRQAKIDVQFLESLAKALNISVVSLMDDDASECVATYNADGYTYEVRRTTNK